MAAELLKIAVDEKRKLVRFSIGGCFTVLDFDQAKQMADGLLDKIDPPEDDSDIA